MIIAKWLVGVAGLIAALAIAEVLDELREEHFFFAAERLRLMARRGRGEGDRLVPADAEQSLEPRALSHV